jgi:hypothetical protein
VGEKSKKGINLVDVTFQNLDGLLEEAGGSRSLEKHKRVELKEDVDGRRKHGG